MIGIRISTKKYVAGGPVTQPKNIIAYDFKNTGTTIVIIDVIGKEPGDNVWTLEPGEAMNTFFTGCADLSKYLISFIPQNNTDPESQFNQLEVTTIKGA